MPDVGKCCLTWKMIAVSVVGGDFLQPELPHAKAEDDNDDDAIHEAR